MQSGEHPGGGELERTPDSHPSLLPPSSFPFPNAPFTWVSNLWPQDVGGQGRDLVQQQTPWLRCTFSFEGAANLLGERLCMSSTCMFPAPSSWQKTGR